VAVTLPDGARQVRQYSLSSTPQSTVRRITVKRIRDAGAPHGEVANWVHAEVAVGDVLTLSNPYGNAVMDTGDTPLLLASAGIGCTPVISILQHLVATSSSRPVTVVHADRSLADHALRRELHDVVRKLPNARLHVWYEQPHPGRPAEYTGFAQLGDLDLPADLQVYLCGPVPFIGAVRQQLIRRGVPAAAIRYELFSPDLAA
jgi:nitric oxide dioxygenase